MAAMEKLLTVEEMAEVLGVAVSTIYQWTHQEYIPHIKIGRFVRFNRMQVEQWLKNRTINGRATRKLGRFV